jgi:peroxiredoxin
MMRYVFPGLALGFALVAVAFALPTRQTGAIIAADSRKPAPDFTLSDSKGVSLKRSDYKGRVVLLDFWATWCGGCKVEIPWYMEFKSKYKDAGLSLIGVSMDEDGWKSVKPFLRKKPITYPIVVGNPALAKLYGVDAMPVTLLIDRDGKIAATHVGMVDKDAFEDEIKTLLQDTGKNGSKRISLP